MLKPYQKRVPRSKGDRNFGDPLFLCKEAIAADDRPTWAFPAEGVPNKACFDFNMFQGYLSEYVSGHVSESEP